MQRSDVRPSASLTHRPVEAASTSPHAQVRRADPDCLLVGQRVRIRLRGGQEVVGQLTGLSRYCLVVVGSQGRLVIYKHGVDWLAPEGTGNSR